MLKPYFLTTKSNLMTKFKMNGKSIAMVLSFFAFMILGSVNASAQWVTPSEGIMLIKQEVTSLENDFSQASSDQERFDIAMKVRYFNRLMFNMANLGMEIPEAIEEARPEDKPVAHSSGLVYLSAEDPNFKNEAQALVNAGTDLLSL